MAKRRESKEKPKRRRAKDVIHAVPDALAVLGMSPIVTNTSMQGWTSPLDYFMEGQYQNGMTVLKSNLTDKGTLKEVAVIEIAAFASKLIGRKLGLNRVGTRKLKLF